MYLQGIQITTSEQTQTFINLTVYHQNIKSASTQNLSVCGLKLIV
jgi:hypothetical protein